jgi:hypothetical protein
MSARRASRQIILPRNFSGIETRREQGIGLRIPAGIIGAVQNAAELVSVFAENGIESAAAFRPQDLVLVMFTHRGDVIGEKRSRLSEN